MSIFVESIAEYILEECGMAFYGVDSLKIFAFYTYSIKWTKPF